MNDNVERNDVDLTVNCAGVTNLQSPFETYRPKGRLDFYLIFMMEGQMDIWTNNGEEIIGPGEAILFYPNVPCRYAMHGSSPIQYYWVHFTGAESHLFVKECGLPGSQILEISDGSFVTLVFEQLLKDFVAEDDLFELSLGTRIRSILIEIARQSKTTSTIASAKIERMNDAIAHIHRHYNEELAISAIAARYYLSESRFRALFKARTGLSPKEYQTQLRIKYAKEKLLDTEYSIYEIAQMVGYSDQLYFSRIFTKNMGISPTEYRRSVERNGQRKSQRDDTQNDQFFTVPLDENWDVEEMKNLDPKE